MNTIARIAVGLALLVPLAVAAADADLAGGKSVAERTCAACHGLNGISNATSNPSPLIVPNLAGQKEAYLVAQLHAFKDGARPNPVMSSMANTLSDEDIQNVAAYYSSLKNDGK